MALNPKCVKGDEIPPEQRSHYVERGGVFVLDIEAGIPTGALSDSATTTALNASSRTDPALRSIDVDESTSWPPREAAGRGSGTRGWRVDKVLNARLASARANGRSCVSDISATGDQEMFSAGRSGHSFRTSRTLGNPERTPVPQMARASFQFLRRRPRGCPWLSNQPRSQSAITLR